MARFLFLALFLFTVGCSSHRSEKVIRLAHSLDEGHTVHQAMVLMQEEVARLSQGALRIEIYPGGQLGSERETLELLQFGSLGMTKVSGAVLESFADPYRLFGVPYLFSGRAQMFRVLDGDIGREILASGVTKRLLGLGYYDSGSRHFYSTFPVERPADLSGKKIRVMNSRSSIAMVDAMGAAATPLPLGDLYTALQQGVVDGAENNLPSFERLRHYEVCDELVLDGHTAVPDVLVMGTPVWDSLSEKERGWLQEAVRLSVGHQRELWLAAEAASLKKLKSEGVRVHQPDQAAFAELGTRLTLKLAADPRLARLMKRVKGTP